MLDRAGTPTLVGCMRVAAACNEAAMVERLLCFSKEAEYLEEVCVWYRVDNGQLFGGIGGVILDNG